ncbi:MAG: hypothetical protein R2867_15800 [Caldilineaceae bacterium]
MAWNRGFVHGNARSARHAPANRKAWRDDGSVFECAGVDLRAGERRGTGTAGAVFMQPPALPAHEAIVPGKSFPVARVSAGLASVDALLPQLRSRNNAILLGAGADS